MKRIVVKIGSNVLTGPDKSIDKDIMLSLVGQVVTLRQKGYQVILVSSGAVACGRSMLRIKAKLDSVEQRQLYSAVGQARLMGMYQDMFSEKGIITGQVLTMKESFSTRREYLNQRSCMEVMLSCGVIPIVNENDTISVTELMFTDNDELSGLVATMMDAQQLVILSNVDGIYNGNPNDPDTSVIPEIKPGDDISCYIGTVKSGFGRGGMQTKYSIARKVAGEGVRVTIANGKRENILTDLILKDGKNVPHTVFVPAESGTSSFRKWIANSQGFAKGEVRIDGNAVKVLKGKNAASLLLVGVTAVEGDFEEGDIIAVLDPNGKRIAVGVSSYSSAEAVSNMGKHDMRPIIHYDSLFIE